MAKSDKATVQRRTQDVTRLLLAGAEFAEIRQYASAQGWGVSDRQVRRYVEVAYKRLAKSTTRKRDQLLGRHLMQRRALYARSLKNNDLRTALQVLRDEANLQGLYPSSKVALTVPDSEHFYAAADGAGLSRQERLVRLVAAEASGDKTELGLVERITPMREYQLPDTMLPLQVLHAITMTYVTEQLDQAGMYLLALWQATTEGDDDGTWDLIASVNAFRFRIRREAWQRFTDRLGLAAGYLIRENYEGGLLEICQDRVCEMSPTVDELTSLMEQAGREVGALQTAEKLADSWYTVVTKMCGG